MRWRKLGLIPAPRVGEWAVSHAMTPTPMLLDDERIRLYVSCRDSQGIGRPGYLDVSAANPLQVLDVCQRPLLDIGRPGTFDENGLLVCSVVETEVPGRLYMYYVGFELGMQIRYRLLTGIAISEDGGETWRRWRETPALERSPEELYFRGGPCVLREEGRYRMWYVAGSQWLELEGKSMPVYELRYLESADGLHWGSRGEACLPLDPQRDEHGFGRPWVLRDEQGYQLHYSVRRRSLAAYRLGVAMSAEGHAWVRRDEELNLDVSASGWDSEAIMYSAPLIWRGRTYCFYNGNDFGVDGIGVAVREDA
ncbi:hypothetical protein [Pseudomonas nicosulfuronedens]